MDKRTHGLQCYDRVRFENVIRTQYCIVFETSLVCRDEAGPDRRVRSTCPSVNLPPYARPHQAATVAAPQHERSYSA